MNAKTVIISDIDDTLKNAHILDLIDMVKKAPRTKGLNFPGMSELFHLIIEENDETYVRYLSNAKEWLMLRSHTRFLNRGFYPSGKIVLRTTLGSEIHKPAALRKIMENVKPDRVILVGDNGQNDARFYHDLIEEYQGSGVKFHTFIRIVYSTAVTHKAASLYEEQVGFTTPIEIIGTLIDKGVIGKEKGLELVKTLYRYFSFIDYLFFPEWTNCEDLIWPYLKTPIMDPSYLDFKKIILQNCKAPMATKSL